MIGTRIARIGGSLIQRGPWGVQLRALSVTSLAKADSQRSALSTIWVPTGGITANEDEFGHGKLVRGGFLRQAHSGIFQLLPLGLRVQDKIEKLIDKHMRSVGASRLSLSTISSEELWRKSDRLESVAPELFRLKDRKETPLILSPTHEEEITMLVAGIVNSYKDLPIRLYQITRKYRDERRPRHGLLRSREFLMKDLYTFDLTTLEAVETYRQVSAAYRAFFDELKLPYLVAEASSGDMGGDLSHEYHLPSSVGEDTVINCDSCGYTANDEVATLRPPSTAYDGSESPPASHFRVWRGISKDRKALINAWYPRSSGASAESGLNLHAVKSAVPELDATIEDPLPLWGASLESGTTKVINVVDGRLVPVFESVRDQLPLLPEDLQPYQVEYSTIDSTASGGGLNLARITDGDACPRCEEGALKIHRALECGHTFQLGTRYSVPLDACVTIPRSGIPAAAAEEGLIPGSRIPLQMGCHGVGVSRIFGAVAEILADEQGLNWPRAIAPFEVAIIPASDLAEDSLRIYDLLAAGDNSRNGLDVVLDDRQRSFVWKMKDADMVGFPVLVIMGRSYKENGTCEVQCRRLSIKETVKLDALPEFISNLLDQLYGINLDTLEPQQLAQVKKQLDEELEHLTTSFAQLHAAQNKFKDCLRCVKSRAAAPEGSNSVLVPLTNSLYVRGELADADTVLVDVGTGFLVEKKLKSAEKFYESKVEELGNNLKDLEVIVQRKQTNARTIEEVLRQKIMAGQGQGDQQA
ncbi:Prolyl-tRNA synthetase [Fusarium oxysporum f. sp. cubense race 1]|uniref:proline--tRNA ligase n=8 Tax=Fusarium oxysporum TaxID=5507 RepID=N4UKI8_FUSC1|nr:Prolyl-tRNA synthetase [Fusarium oxysporum f. sp. cubense race 1]